MKFSKAALTLVLLLTISLCICGCSKDLKEAQTGSVVNYDHGAYLKVEGDNTKDKYYDNVSDAWVAANKILDKNVTVKLYQDWVASDGSFGNGDGFADGAIQPVKRNNNTLILDLNKHKIDRKLSSKASKAIFDITTNVNFTIKNGEITGGYNEGNGGAILFNNDSAVLNLISLKIHDNNCAGSGGGIYFSACNGSASLKDCKIYNNNSDERGGGIYFEVSTNGTPPSMDHFSTKLTLINNIQVKDNHGKNDINDNLFISGKNLFIRINARNINSKSCVLVGINSKDDFNPIAEIQKDSQAKAFTSDDSNYYTSPYSSPSGKYACLYAK